MATQPAKSESTRVDKPAPAVDESFYPLDSLRREIDSAFERFGSFRSFRDWHFPFDMPRGASALSNAVKSEIATRGDVVENKKSYDITLELPGVEEKDIDVSVDAGILTIKGEKRSEETKDEQDYYMRERHFGSFQRSFQLPDDVNADKIAASHVNGVLTVKLPRKKRAKPKGKRISIKSK